MTPKTPNVDADTAALVAILTSDLGATIEHSTDVLPFAVELAINGWQVFPLAGKVPAIRNPHPRGSVERQTCKGECGLPGHGVHDATSNLAQIEAWWTGPYRGANIGARVPNDVFVVDVDTIAGHGHDGIGTMRGLIAEHGALPTTLTSMSGRGDGGCHLFFKHPGGRLHASLGPDTGVDIKTSAGYVVVPPSVHPDTGRPYTWRDAPIVAAPTWLANLVRKPERCAQNSHNPQNPQDPGFCGVSEGSVGSSHNPRKPHRTRLGGGSVSSVSSVHTSPVGKFNEVTSWATILDPAGWTCLDPAPDADGARWRHPSATAKVSATVRYECLFVYSPNTPFPVTEPSDPHGVTKFNAYAVLHHRGDRVAAARYLKLNGYR